MKISSFIIDIPFYIMVQDSIPYSKKVKLGTSTTIIRICHPITL